MPQFRANCLSRHRAARPNRRRRIRRPESQIENKKRTPTPPGEKMSREKMLEVLIAEQQNTCAGCDRKYEDPLIWEIDHITPRSDGGHNGISNRALLCPPCNRIKSNQLTLSGLRSETSAASDCKPPGLTVAARHGIIAQQR